MRSLVGDKMSLLVQAIAAVTIAWTMGLVIAWRLAIVSIAVQPLIIACFYTKRVLLKRMSAKAIKEQNESTKVAAEAVSNLRQSWFAGIALGCSVSIKTCNWCLNYWYGGKLVSKGYIKPWAVFQTVIIIVSTGSVIAEAGSMTTILAKGGDAIRTVFAILDMDTNIEPENPEGYRPEKVIGHVE